MKSRIAWLACLVLAAGCATTTNPSVSSSEFALPQSTPPNYPSNYPPPMTSVPSPESYKLQEQRDYGPSRPLTVATQGWFGISYNDTRDVDTGSGAGNITNIDVDSANMPVIGGVFMKPLGGDKLQIGVEGGLNMGWQGNVEAVAVGGGGALIAADTDVFLFELFAGPYLSWRLTPRAQIYFGAGVALDWASYDYDIGNSHINEDGFGDGVYARTGFEINISPGTWVGLGVRRADSTIDPGGAIDHVDLRQTQYLFTVTHSL